MKSLAIMHLKTFTGYKTYTLLFYINCTFFSTIIFLSLSTLHCHASAVTQYLISKLAHDIGNENKVKIKILTNKY